MLKERMTPEELATLTGYSRQTINKWVRKENWATTKKLGVQGGKARLIHIDERVQEFIHNAKRAADKPATYSANGSTLEGLLLHSLKQMSEAEQQKMSALILREGIAGVLKRLGIRDSE
ncbi:putative DNA-binding transcriptional regulator [Enterobacteriaceae bacterium H20N1]|uniref:DNA-binding transcriptional regulator n=1 Tax=Dryocola boscaweniae TaxID=2925397 RepID=A0A9X2W788_9ENTR|nr:YfeC-like transcriptional regulator [Dryocola boscaweniae]MCT4701398.1 putative DNA-binding transcriptional regulator [Dryocola boscaweniae]MCT4716645.1 putative DNA-binding transcriptional regulator [Dryocola boscaweniae]MCT4718691.1 putative DNA-binding transcriptional regulator [Dryocola boscaweniae]